MLPSLDQSVRDRVKRLWFSGETRKNIAAECEIGAGSVTNIISELKNGLEESDLEWIRELAVQLKKEGTTLAEFACIRRCHNYIKKLGANEEQIESLIVNLLADTRSIPIEKTADLMNMLYELSESESIPPTEVPAYVKRRVEEKTKLDEEIQKAGAILEEKNVDTQTIEEYKKLKNELKKYGLPIKNPRRFVSVLQTIDRIGGEPRKIIRELSQIRSLKRTERQLKKNCMILESRISHCRELLPMCEQIMRLGIGFPELLAFHGAVMKKSDTENIPMETAAYRVMEDIENYGRIGDLKNEISKLVMQRYNRANVRSKKQGDNCIN